MRKNHDIIEISVMLKHQTDAAILISGDGEESVWALLKRGIHGVYHHASEKHLLRYINEFTFRLNEGNVARHTLERLESLIQSTVGQRITYRELVA